MERLEQRYFNQFKDEEVSKVDVDPDLLYCVACNKKFNSLNAFQNHELSKKHKQNVELVKKTMTEEENNFQKSQNIKVDSIENSKNSSDDKLELDDISGSDKESDINDDNNSKACKKLKKTKKKNKIELNYESESEDLKNLSIVCEDDTANWENIEKKMKPKKSKPQNLQPVDGLKQQLKKENDSSDEGPVSSKKSYKKRLGRCSGYGRGHFMADNQ